MPDDPFPAALGLRPVTIQDQSRFQQAFARLKQPISDYSFANVFVWGTSLKLYWSELSNHLCLFANGTGDLTLLLPPLAMPTATAADTTASIAQAFEIMDAYNVRHADISRSRIEYVSDETLEQINAALPVDLSLSASPMSGDFVYPVGNMIDLPGKALKSKRHDRNRFERDYPNHTASLLTEVHVDDCVALLDRWKQYSDAAHEGQTTEDDSRQLSALLRDKESQACAMALEYRTQLGLVGMVVYVGDQLAGFTLGESLSPAQASILFEKTNPDFHGVPQFIFSEFCRLYLADHPEINAGDDWGIPTLRWTKESYRPSRRIAKYVLSRAAAPIVVQPAETVSDTVFDVAQPPMLAKDQSATETVSDTVSAADSVSAALAVARPTIADVPAVAAIEEAAFEHDDAFTARQVRRLITNPHVLSRVVRIDGQVAGWCVGLIRQHARHRSGRVYTLAVSPRFQGRGIGRLLMEDMLSRLEAADVQHIYLEVRTENRKAIELYHRLGFVIVRRLEDYYGPCQPGYSLRRTTASVHADAAA